MIVQEYTQQIANDLFTLPEDKVSEVVDFIKFLKVQVHHQGIPLREAGLSREGAFDLRTRLASFENDWNVHGMEAYDEL
ncbi:DUF2281 domain-containing protein [bacterium]|nr:DUF2281 domain-containing protein [bacterium]MBU1754117.1 DUF2281 domain-containing protein [bacterium]